MKTTDLIEHITTKTGIGKPGVKSVVDAMLEALADAARRGEDISLPGFGVFKVKDVPVRQGRNPATDEAMEIAASRKLAFSPAKPLKDALKVLRRSHRDAGKRHLPEVSHFPACIRTIGLTRGGATPPRGRSLPPARIRSDAGCGLGLRP